MKRAWAWLASVWNGTPEIEKYPEDEVVEHVLRIRRKMALGNWVFTWKGMGNRHVTVIHGNLPTLIAVINKTRTAMMGNNRIPEDAQLSTYSNRGVVKLAVSSYLADDYGRFRNPEEVVKDFVESVVWLSEAIKEVRKSSPLRAESYSGKCVHLFKEISQVAGVLL